MNMLDQLQDIITSYDPEIRKIYTIYKLQPPYGHEFTSSPKLRE